MMSSGSIVAAPSKERDHEGRPYGIDRAYDAGIDMA